MDKKSQWYEILEYARWTASPHNVQPWKVKIDSLTQATIYYDPKRLLPVEDDTGCFTTVGFGMFIENMSVVAHSLGFTITEDFKGTILDPSMNQPTEFLTVTLKKTKQKELFHKELIKNRRTSRLPYNDKPVPDSVITKLQSIAKQFDHEFTFSSDENMINWILMLNRDTIFYDMKDTATRNEIGRWLRYSSEQAHETNDGLWSYCMRFPGLLMYLFFHAQWLFNLPVINQYARNLYFQSTKGTRTVAWLSGPFQTPFDWLRAGHMLSRLWLAMTEERIYLHPFGSIITNPEAHKRLREKFDVDETKNKMWLIMRLGFSNLPPRSLRLSVEDILL